MNPDIDLRPMKVDRGGPWYRYQDVSNVVLKFVENNIYLQAKGKNVSNQIEEATAIINDAQKKFNHALEAFLTTERKFVDATKQASSQVRESADKLMNGLQKVEKTADFSRLEKYVDLLERASVAMNSLAELEKQGKLEKIASALK